MASAQWNSAICLATALPLLDLLAIHRGPEDASTDLLKLVTDRGTILGRVHPAPGNAAVLWVSGAGGGLGGPADGLFSRLGAQVQPRGIASLELDYCRPGELRACVQDVLLGLDWLQAEGKVRVALVGHSFGSAASSARPCKVTSPWPSRRSVPRLPEPAMWTC